MVQKQPKKEAVTNTPYFYPNFSRYNYPKFGADEEVYAEPVFKFPSWDDGLSSYTKRTYPRKNSHRYDDFDDIQPDEEDDTKEDYGLYYNLQEQEEEENEDGLTKCEELHDDINSAKHDAEADYDRFKSHLSSLSDELRALQQEIEETERRYLSHKWGADDEEANSFTESSVLISGFGVGPSPKRSLTSSPTPQATSEVSIGIGGFGSSSRRILLSSPSAMQAATSPYRERSASIKSGCEEEEEDDDCLSGQGSPKGRRCMGLDEGWSQERVHQNEWIRC